MVDAPGRSGTTMLMALLGSSPQVAMERRYPFEHAYFGWIAEWSALADRREWNEERWNVPILAQQLYAQQGDGLVGPPPWSPLGLWEAEGPGDELGPRLLLGAWREFSARAIERTRRDLDTPDANVRYYLEKSASAARLRELSPIPVRAIALHRDPRDIWLSAQAFDRVRGYYGFGRGRGEDEEEWFERFVEKQAQRLRRTLAERGKPDSMLLSYADLVGQPETTAARLGAWLGLELDLRAPDQVLEQHRHATSSSADASISRWRRELEPHHRQRFLEVMGPELRELGYED